jgi:hypothetical protein
MIRKISCAVIAASMVVAPAQAERRVNFEPVAQEGMTVRYEKGMPTVDLRRERGAIQLIPLGLDHGRLTFGVVALNLGTQPDNLGVEDFRATINGQDTPVLTRDRLDQMARNRATWGTIAVALLAGVAAASAASARDRYTATTYTPRGTYRTVISAPSAGGQIAAAGIIAGGGYTINNIRNQLDATREALADEIVQTTTLDPEDSYGGRIVVERPRGRARNYPQQVQLVVSFNGEEYPFTFNVTRAR